MKYLALFVFAITSALWLALAAVTFGPTHAEQIVNLFLAGAIFLSLAGIAWMRARRRKA